MKKIIVFVSFMGLFHWTWSQDCSNIYESIEVDKPVSWNLSASDQFSFLTDQLLPIFETNADSEEPPTSIKIWFEVDKNGYPFSISKSKNVLTTEQKAQILSIFQKEVKLQPATLNGESVCSEFIYVVGCIMYN